MASTIEAFQKTKHSVIEGEHPATLAEEVFLKQVTLDFGRSSGPGGQHRNRKATSCTATQIPSDISGEATERRRQSENRKMAVSRLRRTLATLLRCKLNLARILLPNYGRAEGKATSFQSIQNMAITLQYFQKLSMFYLPANLTWQKQQMHCKSLSRKSRN